MAARREVILGEMGIEVWRRRGAVAAGPADAAQVVPDPASAWRELRSAVSGCTRCALHHTRTRTVFGVGSTTPRWVVVGEAPGADEDRQGEPFVGAAGQLLNEMLRAVGVTRDDVFIANILKCRPPENRDPAPAEMLACSGHLDAQLQLLAPRLIVALGRIAAQHLLQQQLPVGRLRGQPHAWGAGSTPVVVTYHPAYLLRSPAEKRKAWDDLRLARRLVDPRPS